MSLEICFADFAEKEASLTGSDADALLYFRRALGQLSVRFDNMTQRRRRDRDARNALLSMDGEPRFKDFCTLKFQGPFPADRQLDAINFLLANTRATTRELWQHLGCRPSITTVHTWRRTLDATFPEAGFLAPGATRRRDTTGRIIP